VLHSATNAPAELPALALNRVAVPDQRQLPPLGPLVAASLDKAVTIIVRNWVLWAVALAASALSGAAFSLAGFLPAVAIALYWSCAAYANAARLERPDYRMNASTVLTLFGASFFGGLATEVGFFVLVVPGVWIGNSLSMTAIAAVADDLPLGAAFDRSWRTVEGQFWSTIGFNVVVYLAMVGVTVAGYVVLLGLIALASNAFPSTEFTGWSSISPLMGAMFGAGALLYTLAISLTYQMHAIAQLHWYRALQSPRNPISP
jgi:hypothetical protein